MNPFVVRQYCIKNDGNLAAKYIFNASKVEESLRKVFIAEESSDYNSEFIFKDVPGIANWKRHKHALWIKGPSGIGKTEFAKSLFTRPLVVSDIEGLKRLKPTYHDVIIYDDMNFKHSTREFQIHLVDVQNSRDINVKHSSVLIPKGFPRIFTSNVPIFSCDEAIKRRLRLIKVIEDLRVLDEVDSDSSDNSFRASDDDFKTDYKDVVPKKERENKNENETKKEKREELTDF